MKMHVSTPRFSSLKGAMTNFPKLRENVWWIDVKADNALLRTLTDSYEVSVSAALSFLKIRTHCTGHNTLSEIARRSKVSEEETKNLLNGFAQANIFYPSGASPQNIDRQLVCKTFCAAMTLWTQEIVATFIGSKQLTGDLQKGLFLEGWHEAKYVHLMLEEVQQHCNDPLQQIVAKCLMDYKNSCQSAFQKLLDLGFSKQEIETSIPLPSTRLIEFLIWELICVEPTACLIVISLLAARHLNDAEKKFSRPELFSEYVHLFGVTELRRLDDISNKAHDLVHGLILQSQEIKGYYSQLNGNYLPRQAVGFLAL